MTAFLKNYGLIIFLAVAGIVSLAFGITQMNTQESAVVISDNSDPADESNSVLVDVAGAVKQPGVYSLPVSSRISDAIEKAGGITDDADSTYIAKVINKAEVLQDGQKVFIPLMQSDAVVINSESSNELININTASAKQLDELPGIGEVTADKIITNRPYSTVEDLVTKKAVSQSVLEKIQDQITLY